MTPAKVKMYITNNCPYCIRAKNLLDHKNIAFDVVDLTGQPEEIQALKNRTHWKTVPQIFINNKLVGGYTELAELDSSGELDILLKN
jgi:glutaredoxin 3